jgi:hypothetical protein
MPCSVRACLIGIPFQQFAVVKPVALGLAVAIAALPGEIAARAHPAHLLRSE